MDEEKQKLIEELNQLGQSFSQRMDKYSFGAWIDLDLTIGQLKSLMFIDFECRTSLRDLAKAMKMAPPNATKVVDFLVKEGLAVRSENPSDRRLLSLETTAKGKILIANLRESAIRQMSEFLKQFSLEELTALLNGLSPFIKLVNSRKSREN